MPTDTMAGWLPLWLSTEGVDACRGARIARWPSESTLGSFAQFGEDGAIARTRGPAVAGNLPVELSSFVGRSRELLEIRRLLAMTHTVTLTGPGGIGKSRLALHAAHRLGSH